MDFDFMRKSRFLVGSLVAAAGVIALTQPLAASIVGRDAEACVAGKPSILVRVVGFKAPTGEVKVSLYNGDPGRYLARKGKLRNVLVPVTGPGPLDVCIAVPTPGRYAIAVHHDINDNGVKDRHDGGGYSNNPRISITNMRPPFSQTAGTVGNSTTRVGIRLLYLQGLSIRPAGS
jgi:uncharacterized protein (DUF2141 family)